MMLAQLNERSKGQEQIISLSRRCVRISGPSSSKALCIDQLCAWYRESSVQG